jgi:hypothetical protein
MRRLALTTALTGLALAWAVAQAAGQGGPALKVVFTGGTIYHREAVPPGKGHVFRVTCPPGYKPVFGAPASFDPAAPLKASVVSLPSNSWLFRYDNTGSQPVTITVMVLCAKPRPVGLVPGGVKKPLKIVIKKRRITTTVAPLQTKTVTRTCPAGTLPVGAGSDIAAVGSRANAPPVGGNFQGRLSQWEISGRTKTVTADNHSPDTLQLIAELLCGDVVDARGDPVRALVRTTIREFHDTLKPDLNIFHHACPRGMFPWWLGWQFAPGLDALSATYAFDQGGKPVWALFAGQETPVDLYAACTTGSMRVLKRP